MAFANRKKKRAPAPFAIVEHVIARKVPPDRRKEILDYLKLFGSNPDRTILQVHSSGFFNKRRKGLLRSRQGAVKRYVGTTFVIVGRTHDPSIMDQVIKPTNSMGTPAPAMSATYGRTRTLSVGHLTKSSPLTVRQFMFSIRRTGEGCLRPKAS